MGATGATASTVSGFAAPLSSAGTGPSPGGSGGCRAEWWTRLRIRVASSTASTAASASPPSRLRSAPMFCSPPCGWPASRNSPKQERGRDLAWSDAVALHPVAQVMGPDLPGCDDGLVDTARALAVACPWREIRRMISDCDWVEADIPAGIAAWMDDGMLSRWLLDGRVTLAEQLRRLDTRLAPDVARRVRRFLRQLGLPGAPSFPADRGRDGRHSE